VGAWRDKSQINPVRIGSAPVRIHTDYIGLYGIKVQNFIATPACSVYTILL
jgi:hypothetical protein